eukprot:Plantae.Rhodophyta-Hildenbrandia_rubra.ctg377.p1 GENE.Plantae.Rhodophyta-Hildenbrandia_rubra.ctg377~~Plantae.Rhodophyta-Hildenbrandia_rubra.ctg377.p1  ORF type:complete len:401 (+),score=59.34 Plantae.Rhodophyta-Hildenbrandia_rubra.ctg377:339-1541(+)
MQSRLNTSAAIKARLDQWSAVKLTDFHINGKTREEALGALALTAVKMQSQLISVVKPLNAALLSNARDSLSHPMPADMPEEQFARSTDEDAAEALETIIVKNPHDARFREPKREEIEGLMQRGAFEKVKESDAPKNASILKGRFALAIKEPNAAEERFKAKYVIKGHLDSEKKKMVNEAPTALRHSARLLIALASTRTYPIWARDVKQARMQSERNLLRGVRLAPPERLGLPKGALLKVIKQHCDLTEAGACRWLTSLECHLADLNMKQTMLDPRLFCTTDQDGLQGMEATLADDSISNGSPAFAATEAEKSKKFDVKKPDTPPVKFAGCLLDCADKWALTQKKLAESLEAIKEKEQCFEKLRSMRGKLSWLSASTRPDISFTSAQLAQAAKDAIASEDY